MTFLRWQDYPAWSTCPGRPALEESEGALPEDVPALSKDDRAWLDARRTVLANAGASVEVLPLQALDVGAITADRGALGFGSVVLAEYQDHAALEVWPQDKILALAALLKFSILHGFTTTNAGAPDELYRFGAQVTEAAQLSLNLRASVTALEHLVPSDHCKTCRSAYRCPALTKEVHSEVFGPLEAVEDAAAVPAPPKADADWKRYIAPKVPLIEYWLTEVKRELGLKPDRTHASKAVRKKPRKQHHRKAAKPRELRGEHHQEND